VLLSGSRADVKAAAATAAATRGASDRIGPALDEIVANLVTSVSVAFQDRVQSWVDEIKDAIGAPPTRMSGDTSARGGFGTGPAHEAAGVPAQAQRAD
jgi:hypothetical protein